jgi:hypothetical protein
MKGYVYAIHDEGDGIKLGKTKNPVPSRLLNLQTGNKERLGIYGFLPVDNMVRAERLLHDLFARWHKPKGGKEWFVIPPKDRRLLDVVFRRVEALPVERDSLIRLGLWRNENAG